MKVETKGKIVRTIILSKKDTDIIKYAKQILLNLENAYEDFDEEKMVMDYEFEDKTMTLHTFGNFLGDISDAWGILPPWE